jgi:hypothetical protein
MSNDRESRISLQQAGKRPLAFVIQPFSDRYRAVYELIAAAAAKAGVGVAREEAVNYRRDIATAINNAISQSDFLIVDVSEAHPNVMYELGFARSIDKPTILIANSSRNIPSDLAGLRVLIYDVIDPSDFVTRLADLMAQAAKAPEAFNWTRTITDSQKRQSVFISYSHADIAFLHRLIVHLRPLEKEGLIDVWVDTRLRAGDRWQKEIEKALSKASVALLLVSADFLASDFITNNELPPLLRKAEDKGTKIIPMILKPCRFTRDNNLKQFQAVNAPEKSLIMLSEGEQEVLYDRVASEVEQNLRRG